MNTWDKKWSQNPQASIDFSTRRIFLEMLERIPSFEGKTVMELGSGSGRLGLLALESGAKEVILVDNSDVALKLSQELIQGKKNIRFIQQDILTLPGSLKADIVFSSGVLEHFRGEELDRLFVMHRDSANERGFIIVPAAPHYNNLRMRFEKSTDEFGWQQPFTKRRLIRILKRNQMEPSLIKRFFVTYGMKGLQRQRPKIEERMRFLESVLGGLFLIEITR